MEIYWVVQKNADGFVYDYFADIFNKVDLHREELLKEIKERYEEIIKILKKKQQKCRLNTKNIEKINLNELESDLFLGEAISFEKHEKIALLEN